MTRVEHEILIRRPPEEVFAFVVDPANVPLWQPSVVRMRADGPLGIGMRVTQTRRLMHRTIDLVAEICAYEPCRRFGLRIVSGAVPGTVHTNFSPVDGATRLHLVAEVAAGGPLRLVGAALGEAARRELVANCERLKSILEAPRRG